jgi:hypothetical protein
MTDTAIVEELLTQCNIEVTEKERFLKLLRKLGEKNAIAIQTIKTVLEKILWNHSVDIETLTTKLADAQAQLADAQAQLADAQAQLADAQAQLADAQDQLAERPRPSTETHADSAQLAERPSTETHAVTAQLVEARAQLAEALAEIERLRAQPHAPSRAPRGAAKHTEASDTPGSASRRRPTGLLAVNSCCELPHPGRNPSFDDVCQTIRETPPSKLIGVSYTAASKYDINPPISQTGEIMFRDCLPHFKAILHTLHKTHIDPNVVKLGPFFLNHTNNTDQIKCCIVRLLRAVQNRAETEAVVTHEPLALALLE